MSDAQRSSTPAPKLDSAATGSALRVQRKCGCGAKLPGLSGECNECKAGKLLGLQAKLEVGGSDDAYEREADRAADQVMSGGAASSSPLAQLRVQRAGGSAEGFAPGSVHQAVETGGNALEGDTRAFYESRFGHDFSRVRIHTGPAAERSASDVHARAYTVGHDVVFGAGAFAPGTHEGRRLIAHELAHVVQQSAAPAASRLQRKEAVPPADGRYAGMPLEEAIKHLGDMPQEQALVVLKRWQKFIAGSIDTGEERIRSYIQLRAESFGNYLIGGTIEFFGGTSPPSDDWKEPWRHLNAAEASIGSRQVVDSVQHLSAAAGATRKHWEAVTEFLEKTEEGASRSIFALQALEVAGAAAITVLTAGQGTAAMVAAGTAYAGTQRFAGEATSVAIGIKDRIDFAGIAFDMLLAALMGKFLGSLGGKVANSVAGAIIKRAGESAARQVAAKITAQLVASVLVGRASGVVHAVVREAFDALRGEKSTSVDAFMDAVAQQLSARAVFLDMIGAAASMGMNPKSIAPNPAKPRLVAPAPPPVRRSGAPLVNDGQGQSNVIPLRRGGGSGTDAPVAAGGESNVIQLRRGGSSATGGPMAGRGDSALLAPVIEPAPAVPALELAPPAVGKGPAPPGSVAPTAVAISAATTVAQPVPKEDEDPKPQKCPFPMGKTDKDAIPIQWFKPPVDWFFPDTVTLTRPHHQTYDRLGGPTRLAYGDRFGVLSKRWPKVDKILQYKFWDRHEGTPKSDLFREMLANDYGWRPSRDGLDIDHVQDPQWGEPDGDLNGAALDHPSNFWPLSYDLNRSAGANQNRYQRISYCLDENSPPRVDVPVLMLRVDRMWGRYFVIRNIDFTR